MLGFGSIYFSLEENSILQIHLFAILSLPNLYACYNFFSSVKRINPRVTRSCLLLTSRP